jgi:hypothetical protein
MADARHEQTLAHLRLLAGLPGYWELRALHREAGSRMMPRGSIWIVATATADGLLYERLDQALAWADGHDRQGTELFAGVNGRAIEGKTKAAVPAVTACFADLDLAGESIDGALVALTGGSAPEPSFIVHNGYGLPSGCCARAAVTRPAGGRSSTPSCAPSPIMVPIPCAPRMKRVS